MLRPIFTILLLLLVNSQIAQDMIVYYESQPGQSQTDTLYVYFQSLTGQPIDVASVTLSVCYTSGAQLQPTQVQSDFAAQWGTTYEVCTSEAELASYDGIQFANRAKYGITTLNPSGISIPAISTGLGQLMMKLPFSVSGTSYGQYHIENATQNRVNEIGTSQGNNVNFITWNAAQPFPVEWLSFHAEANEAGAVELSWETATELNNDYFEIEKSFDGLLFQSLSRVKGMLQSSRTQSYAYLDNGYMREKMFYRIKQVDLNGAFSYSNVVEVNMSNILEKHFQVSPVPFDDQLTVYARYDLPSDLSLSLFDVTGRLVSSHLWKAGQTEMQISTGQLKPGVYIMKIVDSFGKVENTPIVKK